MSLSPSIRLLALQRTRALVAFALGILVFFTYQSRPRKRDPNPVGINNVSTSNKTSDDDPQLLLAKADHFYWLNNPSKAAPLYTRAEKLFADKGNQRSEIYARVGRLRSNAETMSFDELARLLNEQLQDPIVRGDRKLRLWCLIAKGYTDIEIDYRATKRDWLEAQVGEKQWVTRASGELGLVAFLEGNPTRAARLLGGALLSTMASGDIGGQIRFLELLGRGFEEVNRHAEALRFFDRAIKLAVAEKDSGLPFMAYEGKAQALIATGKASSAKRVLEDALMQARSQEKGSHDVQLLILLGNLAAQMGDKKQAIEYLEAAGQFAIRDHLYRMEADAMFECRSSIATTAIWLPQTRVLPRVLQPACGLAIAITCLAT